MGPMPTTTALRLTGDGAIRTLTLARPERLNALSVTLLTELVEISRWLDAEPEVKVVIVRGEGRAFCAGFDLANFTDTDAAPPGETAELGRRMADAVTDMRPLTIAAVHGHCIGGGLVLAAACDLRVAATSARFAIPEVDLGIPLAWGGIPRLVREIGPALTKELVMTCRPFDADEALRSGFLNRVVDDERLDAEVDALVQTLLAKPKLALLETKAHVNAVTESMVGTGRSWADADGLYAGLRDPEGQASARAYVERLRR